MAARPSPYPAVSYENREFSECEDQAQARAQPGAAWCILRTGASRCLRRGVY